MTDDLLLRLDRAGEADLLAREAAARIRALIAAHAYAELERVALQARLDRFYQVVGPRR